MMSPRFRRGEDSTMTPQILKQTLHRALDDKTRDGRLAFAVYAESPWTGESELEIDGHRLQVVPCRSMLEMRQALVERNRPLVLLTVLDDNALSADLLARFYGHLVIEIDVWELIAERFKAKSVERRLRRDRALAQRVLSWLDGRQPPAVPSGVLSEVALWTYVLRETVGFTGESRPDVAQLLEWRSDSSKWNFLSRLPSEIWAGLSDWLRRTLGDGISLLLDISLTASPLAVATALLSLNREPLVSAKVADARHHTAKQVISPPDAAPNTATVLRGFSDNDRVEWGLARGRFEQFLGNRTLDGSLIREYTTAAESILRSRNPEDIGSLVRQADDLLTQIGAVRFARTSSWSAVGSRLLLDDLASDLRDGTLLSRFELSFARFDPNLVERVKMAIRLERWLSRPELTLSKLEDAVIYYWQELSWVDWARTALRNVATDSAGFNRTLADVWKRASERRDRLNLAFARLLAAQSRAFKTLPGLLGVEQILDSTAAPIAQHRRVLLVVMDGMSWPILRELTRDLTDRRWREFRKPSTLPCAISVLPSATQYSRCSLLSGSLNVGGQQTEERNFNVKFPEGVLFHKNDLVNFANSDVAREIGNERRRIVAIVVNAIDDMLSGSEQTTESWSLRRIAILQAILAEAELAGRTVILTSDHGHVVEFGTTRLAQPDASDRWREGKPESEDEIALAGPRVLAGASVVALATERSRYALKSHNGYHGGVTPQECIVPLVVLDQQENLIEGWVEAPSDQPSWWTEAVSEPAPVRARPKPSKAQAGLFEQHKTWIDELLESEIFKAQIGLTAGHVKPEQVVKLLRVLDAAPGNRLLRQAFASQMQMNVLRVGPSIAVMQRVLNFDSYPVLTLDEASGYVILDQQLLSKQFGLP
jgi:PglZ domain